MSAKSRMNTAKRRWVSFALLVRDGRNCWLCGRDLGSDITIEHLVPAADGGGNELDNLVLAHARCNMAMGARPVEVKREMKEWTAKRRTLMALRLGQ